MIRATAAVVAALAGPLLGALLGSGCGPEPSALVDSYPIALARAPMGGGLSGDGALLARGSLPKAPDTTFDMIVDTGNPTTLLDGPAVAQLATFKAGFDVFDASDNVLPPPLRASFRNLDLLPSPLQPAGDGSVMPGAVLGGNLLRGFSVALRLGAACTVAGVPSRCSSMTLWNHLGADESFLEDAGYAVYRFSLYGGGEVTALGPPDFLGASGPLVLPATRVVLRTCALPAPFAPSPPPDPLPIPVVETCCTLQDAHTQATGVNLALLLSTGVGPIILSQSALDRVNAQIPLSASIPVPSAASPSLFVATWPVPIVARWTTIPRLAFVDLEEDPANDPGACVELGRSRRTEQVSYARVNFPEDNLCGQPCDRDPREPNLVQSSAAYLELGGQIPVAVVADDEAYLQALSFDVRPEGPQLDGVVGAGALGRARLEIDYLSSQPRILFACEEGTPRDECWAAARCPRLPNQSAVHMCFQLPAHGLPPTCAPSICP